VALVQI